MMMPAKYEKIDVHMIFTVVLSNPLSANMCQLGHKSFAKYHRFQLRNSSKIVLKSMSKTTALFIAFLHGF